jgi:hypothetical protein
MPVENLWNVSWLAIPQAASKTRSTKALFGSTPGFARIDGNSKLG